MSLASKAFAFVNAGIADDSQKFMEAGIDEVSTDALPYYARWLRQDVVGLYFMLAS